MNTSEHDAPLRGADQETCPPRGALYLDDPTARRRRNGLKQVLDRHGMSPADLARMCDMPTPNTLYNFLNGRSASLAMDTIERILSLLPGVTIEELTGMAPRPAGITAMVPRRPVTVPLLHVACADVWRRLDDLYLAEQITVPIVAPWPRLDADAFAVRVVAPGAELLYPDDTILVCQPLSAGCRAMPTGSHLIVRQDRRGNAEITAQEFVLEGDHGWLCLRSTRPEHHRTTRVDLPLAGAQPPGERAAITILGVVVASWRLEPVAALI